MRAIIHIFGIHSWGYSTHGSKSAGSYNPNGHRICGVCNWSQWRVDGKWADQPGSES